VEARRGCWALWHLQRATARAAHGVSPPFQDHDRFSHFSGEERWSDIAADSMQLSLWLIQDGSFDSASSI
jgi:hypothetical protein